MERRYSLEYGRLRRVTSTIDGTARKLSVSFFLIAEFIYSSWNKKKN